MWAIIAMAIRNNWLASVAICVVVILALALISEKHHVSRLTTEMKLCDAQKQSLSLSNASLLASLRQQNEAVKMMSAVSSEKKALSKKAVQTARTNSTHYMLKAQKIREVTLDGNECHQLKTLLQHYAVP